MALTSDAVDLPIHATLLHPRTGTPLRAIAIHPRTGLPVWPVIGGDGNEPDANDWSKVFGDKTPEQVKADLDAAAEAVKEAGKPKGGDDPWSKMFDGQKPEDVKTALEESRKWEGRAKSNKGKADQLDELIEKITGKKVDKPDADKLAADLTAAQQGTRETRIENAVLRRAAKLNGDASALVDSLTFMGTVRTLDPAAGDFASKVDAAIKAAVDGDDRFKVTSGPRPVRQQGQPSEGSTGGVSAGADLFAATRGKSKK